MLKWISLLVLFLASLLISTHACPVLGLLLVVLTPSNVRFVPVSVSVSCLCFDVVPDVGAFL